MGMRKCGESKGETPVDGAPLGVMIDAFTGDLERCQNEALEPHPCPFREEIYEDSKTLCRCCEECMNECCDDI